MQREFPKELLEISDARQAVGRYGLSGKQQIMPIKNLSDGQRSRLIFCWLAHARPHMLILDEPTNHLDLETIDSLARAIKQFGGGVVLVSHDFRLIDQVAEEIWIAENQVSGKSAMKQKRGLTPTSPFHCFWPSFMPLPLAFSRTRR